MYQVPKRPLGNQSQQQFGHHNLIKSSESMLLSDSSKANFIRRKNDNTLIVVSFPEEVYPYFKYEHLASIYKSLLCNKSQEVGLPYPIYESYEVKEGNLNGWRGTCTYNNHVYNCIGLMQTSKQVEQSSSEVCMRLVGYLPKCSSEDYTIQPYRGGVTKYAAISKINKLNLNVIGLVADFLCELDIVNVDYAVKVKKVVGDINDTNPNFYGIACISNKTIICVKPSYSALESQNEVAKLILKYFGVTDTEQLHQLNLNSKNSLQIHSNCYHPFTNAPTLRPSWIHSRYERSKIISENELLQENLGSFLQQNININEGGLLKHLALKPSFKDVSGIVGDDLCVAEILSPHVVLIGNENFSIKLFCKNKTLFCKNRGRSVVLLAGHQIRGLEYCYKIDSPEIYLVAENCFDLHYPNPAQTVVTSCGIVIIVQETYKDNKSKHVLLKRKVEDDLFSLKSQDLISYFNCLISQEECQFDVKEFTTNIKCWKKECVEQLSLMSMDSMKEFLSLYVPYDDRWNEIFITELPNDLAMLKQMCSDELQARTQEHFNKLDGEEKSLVKWELPVLDFKPRFLTTIGPFIESGVMCIYRGVREHMGLSLSLADIESCSSVDILKDDSSNPHRGDVIRYYIWAKCKRGQTGDYKKDVKDDSVLLPGEVWLDEKLINQTTTPKQNESNVRKTNERKPERIDQESSLQTANSTDTSSNVIEEYRWFELNKASDICPIFKRIFRTKKCAEAIENLCVEPPKSTVASISKINTAMGSPGYLSNLNTSLLPDDEKRRTFNFRPDRFSPYEKPTRFQWF